MISSTLLGRVSIVPKGEYNAAYSYERLDVVIYSGAAYIALKASVNQPPDNTEYWMKMVESGIGITAITGPDSSGLTDTYTIHYSRGEEKTFDVKNGRGIDSITPPETPGVHGETDTYTILYNDGTSSTFVVSNGNDGQDGILYVDGIGADSGTQAIDLLIIADVPPTETTPGLYKQRYLDRTRKTLYICVSDGEEEYEWIPIGSGGSYMPTAGDISFYDAAVYPPNTVGSGIIGEKNRALAAESVLGGQISAESIRAQNAEAELAEAVLSEEDRAMDAESDLAEQLSDEIVRAQNAEASISAAVTNVLLKTEQHLTSAEKATVADNLGLGDCAKEDVLPIAKGGTGATTAAGARQALGLGASADLDVIPVENGGTGSTTAEGARANLELGSLATLNIVSVSKGGTGATTEADARTNLGLGALATMNTVPVTNGGTGASTAEGARANLGLGSLATMNSVAVENGGTGATTASGARQNLGLGSLATMNSVPVAYGGTGATTAAAARLNLGAQQQCIAVATSMFTVGTSEVSVTVPGVLADKTKCHILAVPTPDTYDAWLAGGVRMTDQDTNVLKFKALSSTSVKAQALIFITQ